MVRVGRPSPADQPGLRIGRTSSGRHDQRRLTPLKCPTGRTDSATRRADLEIGGHRLGGSTSGRDRPAAVASIQVLGTPGSPGSWLVSGTIRKSHSGGGLKFAGMISPTNSRTNMEKTNTAITLNQHSIRRYSARRWWRSDGRTARQRTYRQSNSPKPCDDHQQRAITNSGHAANRSALRTRSRKLVFDDITVPER